MSTPKKMYDVYNEKEWKFRLALAPKYFQCALKVNERGQVCRVRINGDKERLIPLYKWLPFTNIVHLRDMLDEKSMPWNYLAGNGKIADSLIYMVNGEEYKVGLDLLDRAYMLSTISNILIKTGYISKKSIEG